MTTTGTIIDPTTLPDIHPPLDLLSLALVRPGRADRMALLIRRMAADYHCLPTTPE